MDFAELNLLICQFSNETHGSSNYGEDQIYIVGEGPNEFIPFSFLKKKFPEKYSIELLLENGYIYENLDFWEDSHFKEWYEKQFAHKLSSKLSNGLSFLYRPDHQKIFECVEKIHTNYQILKNQKILMNSKNFPIQLGEWYAKIIFGLKQVKSTSQRGFDFELSQEKIEVKIHWKIHHSDRPSPKGVKIRKSLVQLSQMCILIYLSQNFKIKEICVLDSVFILRKFDGKGHTVFLKDADISSYFFSKSGKHFDRIVNKKALMEFASPSLALKLEGRL